MSLDSIVTVTITRQTKTPSRAGFGTGAFVSEGAVFQELIKEYEDIDAVNADVTAGWLDADAQTAAQRYFGQTNAPEKLYIIKKGADRAHVQEIVFEGAFVVDNSISIDIDGTPVVTPWNTDTDTTLQDIATNIALEAGVATAVADTDARSILVTGASVNTEVLIENIVVTLGASQTTGSVTLIAYFDEVQTYVESITRAQLVNDDWYGLCIESKDKVEQEPVADAIEPLTKFFAYSTADDDAKDAAVADDILSLLQAKSYDRSLGLFSADAENHPEMGWIGGQLPKDPGSITWAYQTIAGAVVDTTATLDATGKSAVDDKNGNTYTTTAAVNLTEEGKVASGEWMDIIRGIDFIVARMQEFVFALKINEEKVPYTDDGIASIENEMRRALRLGVNNTIITEDYTVTVPAAADIPAADKANRILEGMEFTAILAGAIHKTRIEGTLTY